MRDVLATGLFIPGITTEQLMSELEKGGEVEEFLRGHEMFCGWIPKWIPVSVMLPPDNEMNLVTCKTKKGTLSVNRAYYMDGVWHGSGSMSGVTAWMPLPNPYKGD